jgi:DNA-binding PadR family transcriptional regulator
VALHHLVLALLADGPSHGYEVRARFDASVGEAWGPVNIGQVYQVLDRLRRDGLVVGDHVPQSGKPDRTVFTLTAEGRGALDEWLSTPTVPRRGYRDEFFLKLIAAAGRGQPELLALIGRQRPALTARIGSLREARRATADPAERLLLHAALQHAVADMHTLDEAEASAAALASHAAHTTRTDVGVAAASPARRSARR